MRSSNCRLGKRVNASVGLLLFVLQLSCTKTSNHFEEALVQLISSRCRSEAQCSVRVSDVTTFQWDKMYVFKYTATHSEVERALGRKFEGYLELHRRVVFTRGNEIVFHEEEPTDIEKLVSGEVVFDIPDANDYQVYDSETTFAVTKLWNAGDPHYRLTKR
jgi:hypothetical protein